MLARDSTINNIIVLTKKSIYIKQQDVKNNWVKSKVKRINIMIIKLKLDVNNSFPIA